MNPKMPISKENEYSHSGCTIECGLLHIVKNCQCVPFVRSDRYRTCEVDEIWNCQFQQPNSIQFRDEIIAEFEKCEASCGIPCKMRYLDTHKLTMRIGSVHQESELNEVLISRNFNTDPNMQNLIFLEVYFTSMSVKVYELYEVMSFDNFISSSGGLMELWAGMSFLTIFQAICYLIKSLGNLRPNKDTMNKRTENSLTLSANNNGTKV